MPEHQPLGYTFCPLCSEKLQERELEGKKYQYCPNDRWTYYPRSPLSAVAVIVRGEEVYMVQRGKDPYKDTWMFPAGFCDFGELPEDTAKREALEETGLEVVNPRYVTNVLVDDDPREPGQIGFFFKFDVDTKSSKEIQDKDENQNQGWFHIDDLPSIGWRSHQLIAQQLQKRKL